MAYEWVDATRNVLIMKEIFVSYIVRSFVIISMRWMFMLACQNRWHCSFYWYKPQSHLVRLWLASGGVVAAFDGRARYRSPCHAAHGPTPVTNRQSDFNKRLVFWSFHIVWDIVPLSVCSSLIWQIRTVHSVHVNLQFQLIMIYKECNEINIIV